MTRYSFLKESFDINDPKVSKGYNNPLVRFFIKKKVNILFNKLESAPSLIDAKRIIVAEYEKYNRITYSGLGVNSDMDLGGAHVVRREITIPRNILKAISYTLNSSTEDDWLDHINQLRNRLKYVD